MARTVKPEEFASRRKEILDVAQRLVLTKGYEQMAVRDILEELQISSGAFHHYFGSREELLDALIEQIREGSQVPLLPIIHDPQLKAIQKLQGFFNTLDSLRFAHQREIIRVGRVWYKDENAIVRVKVDEAVINQRAPLINAVVRQGIDEGVFSVAVPEEAGEVILTLLQGMGNAHARLMLTIDQAVSAASKNRTAADAHGTIDELVRRIVTIHAAYMDAIERFLGAPPNCLYRVNVEAVQVWVRAMEANQPAGDDGGAETGTID